MRYFDHNSSINNSCLGSTSARQEYIRNCSYFSFHFYSCRVMLPTAFRERLMESWPKSNGRCYKPSLHRLLSSSHDDTVDSMSLRVLFAFRLTTPLTSAMFTPKSLTTSTAGRVFRPMKSCLSGPVDRWKVTTSPALSPSSLTNRLQPLVST